MRDDYVDAEFRVVSVPGKRHWWQGWYIDWRNALMVAGLAVAVTARHWLGH